MSDDKSLMGAVFITADSSEMIVVEDESGGLLHPTDLVFYRIVMSDNSKHLGRRDWCFLKNLMDLNGRYTRIA